MTRDNAAQDHDLLTQLTASDAAAPSARAIPPAQAPAPPPHAPAPTAPTLGFQASGKGGGFNFRILLFVLIILAPIVGLGLVYARTALSDGTKQMGDGSTWVDLQKMVSFEFDQRNGRTQDIPEQWRALDGQTVVLEGEMVPTTSAAGQVRDFELVWSVSQCCFTGSPQVQHFVKASVPEGKRVDLYRQPVRVKGKLTVDARQKDGQVTGLWWLDVDSVEPVG